jgi:hypothetical protein
MKKSFSGLTLLALAASFPLVATAEITVYSDNFATDSSVSSSYLSANTTGGTGWAFNAGTGLNLNPSGSGKLSDLVGSFSAVTLANPNDYISFEVNFSSANIAQGGASTAGGLLFALDNSFGVSPTSQGATESVSSTAAGGATAGYEGYLGDIAFNNSPKTGTKFFAKTGAGNNNLSYNSNVSPKTQISTSVANANNANLVNNDSYTLTYTVTALNVGASQDQITAQIYDNTLSQIVDNFTLGATNGAAFVTPTATFDTFDIGVYTGSEGGYAVNVSSISVVESAPEPGTLALVGAGIAALAGARRLRK